MRMNLDRAERVIAFLETLRTPDGANVGQPLVLRPWQKQIVREVYGPARTDGRRMVRQAVLSLARKNGKSALVAGLCLAHLCGPEAIRNGQLYSLSIDREQAGILFNYSKAMVEMDEELSVRLNVIHHSKQIVDPVSGSRFAVLSGEKKGKMGKSSSFIAFDELAEFGPDRALYDALMTSRGAHAEPLVWVFSTQAPADLAVLSELVDYGQKVNEGTIEDPTFKAFIYTVPMDADPWDELNWYLANPALGDFNSLEIMRETAEKAKRMPSAEAAFRNLHLNQRVDAAAHFLTPEVWKLGAAGPDEDLFRELPVYGGLDLSSKNDLSALVLTVRDADADHVICRFWTPGDNLRDREDRDRAPYCLWRDQGHLIAVPGKTIDYGFIAREIKALCADYGRLAVKFDRWRIDDFSRELERAEVSVGIAQWIRDEKAGTKSLQMPEGELELVLIPHGQGYQDMSPAVEALEDAAVEGRLRHGMHPVLTWCAANARTISDPAGNRKFDKIKSTGRIDGLVALSMALNGAERGVEEQDTTSVYETRGVISL